jgi:hypothetical protein
MVRATSARPSAARLVVPAKMTSSIFWLRTADGAWAPSTQPMASTTLDLPDPFGPTTTVTPGSRSSTVVSAKDLKPFSVSVLRNICQPRLRGGATPAAHPRSELHLSPGGCAPEPHRRPARWRSLGRGARSAHTWHWAQK